MCVNENRDALEPYFLELGGHVPALLSEVQERALCDLTQSVLGVFGDGISGVIHFEAKVNGQEAIPIELNLRLGGAETYMLVKLAYGVRRIGGRGGGREDETE